MSRPCPMGVLQPSQIDTWWVWERLACPMGVLQPSQIDTWWVWERHNEQAMSHGCVAVLTDRHLVGMGEAGMSHGCVAVLTDRHLVGMGEAGSHNTANQTDSGRAQA